MWYTNNLKTLFFIFMMLSIHEMSHILTALYFKYEVDQVIIYPFGLCAQMKHIGYGSVYQELLIVAAGPLVHVVFPFVFQWLLSMQLISSAYADYLHILNTSILIFNLLPVYPLDGGRILQSLYHIVLPYRKAQLLTFITSIINLALLFYYRFLNGFSGIIVMVFLGMQIIMSLKDITFSQLSFFRYRYLHPVTCKDKINEGEDLYRARHNIMVRKHGWINEHDWLKMHYHKDVQEEKAPYLI